ncbi:MAG: hypothetical protein KatS3mg033_0150 [Thermonema sp.]|uniref:CorA family divalent cation transporter n=1 Tax=Thermonema sp. TaxID=2231181 RepID=UPI0021DEF522|nr:CorA family divalent cation transporter [Thermonema sp.]GIV38350.1 MAG: hypothetical protein KatS3mg033_0150 [Thermonema sp.]
MIRVFYLNEVQEIKWVKLNNPENEIQDFQNVIWIDLQSPSEQEKRIVEELYGIEFFTPQEAAEIESSSRYYEDQRVIEANNTFVVYENKFYVARQVSFILKSGILFTLRNNDLKAFADVVRRLKGLPAGYITRGTQIWMMILETRIDLDADFIEYLSRVTNISVRKSFVTRNIRKKFCSSSPNCKKTLSSSAKVSLTSSGSCLLCSKVL